MRKGYFLRLCFMSVALSSLMLGMSGCKKEQENANLENVDKRKGSKETALFSDLEVLLNESYGIEFEGKASGAALKQGVPEEICILFSDEVYMQSGVSFGRGSVESSALGKICAAYESLKKQDPNSVYAAAQLAVWSVVNEGSIKSLSNADKQTLNNWGAAPSIALYYDKIYNYQGSVPCYRIPAVGNFQDLLVWENVYELNSYVSFYLRKTDSFDGSSVKDCTFAVQQYHGVVNGVENWTTDDIMSWSEADNCYVSKAILFDDVKNDVAGFKIVETSAGAGHVLGAKEVFHENGVTRYSTEQLAINNRISASGNSSITNAPKTLGLKIRKYIGSQVGGEGFGFKLQEYDECIFV